MLLSVLILFSVGSLSVSARTYFIPSSQKLVREERKSDRAGYYHQRGNEVYDGLEDYVDSEEYPRSVRKFRDSKNYYSNDHGYVEVPLQRYKPEVRDVQPIVIKDHAPSDHGPSVLALLKTLAVILLAVGVPALLFLFVVIPFKLLAGLKMFGMTHLLTLAAIAATYFLKHHRALGDHHGGWGGGGGGGGGGGLGGVYSPLTALGALAAISTPITSSNVNQPITQPISQVISTPVSQTQNAGNQQSGGGGSNGGGGGCNCNCGCNCGCNNCGCQKGGHDFPSWAIPLLIELMKNWNWNMPNYNGHFHPNHHNNNHHGNNGTGHGNGPGNGNGTGNGSIAKGLNLRGDRRTPRNMFTLEAEDIRNMSNDEFFTVMRFIKKKLNRS